MAGLDDLSRGELADILRRLRILETASPLQNASIGEDGIRVYGGGVINIENGGLVVNGTATIHGVLNADGTINFTGPVTISGPLTISGTTDITGDTTVTGDLDVNGPMKTVGTLSVEGVTTLKNDLNVTTGGRVKAGASEMLPDGTIKAGSGLSLKPSGNGGSGAVDFGNGSQLYATGSGGFAGTAGSSGIYVTGASATIDGGSGEIVVTSDGLRVTTVQLTTQPPNVYIHPTTGVIYRSTA